MGGNSPRLFYGLYKTPLGVIVGFVGSDGALLHLGFYKSVKRLDMSIKKRFPGAVRERGEFADLMELLERYFHGERIELDYPVKLSGTRFQLKVWKKLREIRYGEVKSYGWVAREVGAPKAARAVGGAVARNPVALIIPCHRVIRSDGGIGGFGYGVALKRKLLRLEGVHI